MNNSAAITGLDRALEVVQGFQKVDSKSLNLQLADQIQFSSILKMQVDTPEQTLAAAQGPVQPPERPARPEVSHQERREPRARVDEHASAPAPGDTKPDFAANVVDDHRGDHGQAGDGAPQSNSANQSGTGSPNNDEASVQTGDAVSGVDDFATEEFVALVSKPDDVRANNTSNQTNVPADVAMQKMAELASGKPGKAPESHGQLTSKSAQENFANVLTSDKFQTVGEDLYMAVSNKPNTASIRSGNHSAGSALKNQQGSDLAQRLGGGIQASVQVSVVDSAHARAMPIHALANGAMMAQMDPGDDGANFLNANLNQAGGKGVLPDRAAAGNHGADGKAPGQNTEQGNAANFGLAVRNTAIASANTNAANAALKVAPITAESANVTNVSGPAGPSQISQTAKLNPTTAARQPYKPPVPVEQISMQIQKAVGEGADKINIKLNPAHLGRIEVKLQIGKDGHLSAVILAEKPETLSLLQKDAAGLEKALQEAGLRTDSSSLNFGLKENNNTTTESGRDRENSHGGRPSEKDDTPDDQKDQGLLQNANVYGRNMSANGGVDIRI